MTSGLEEPVKLRLCLLWYLLRRVMLAQQRAELDDVCGILQPRCACVEPLLGAVCVPPLSGLSGVEHCATAQ